MRFFTADELQQMEQEFRKEGFLREKSTVGGIIFPYYVLPPSHLSEFPYFTLGFTAKTPAQGHLYIISAAVEDRWKPYWVYHVVTELGESNPLAPYACLNALRREFTAAGNLVDRIYLLQRKQFFGNLLEFMEIRKEWYSDEDLLKVKCTLDFLVEGLEPKRR